MRRLIGRDVQLAELIDALNEGRGALIWGSAGVGKTALAAAVAGHMVEHGDHVDWIVATAASRVIPFGALAPLLVDDLDADLPPTLVLAAISRRLRAVHRRRGPLLVVDDAHLLDDASAATLLGLVSSGAARLLVTVRSGERSPDAVDALWKDGFLASTMLPLFDRATTRTFLDHLLGGEVASSSAELLWRHTQGNALYLSELAAAARSRKQLVNVGGVWVWEEGRLVVPPRLAELLARRFAGLSDEALDALAALVLGEPLSAETLIEVASVDALGELEDRGLVIARDRDGRPHFGFSHPLLGTAAADQLNAARRRRVADALIDAHDHGVDPVRSALWQLDASGPAAVDQLSAGARSVLLTQPGLARQLAARAVSLSADPGPALLLADAHAELGELAAAQRALEAASARVRSPEDQVSVALTRAGMTTFMARQPEVALDVLDAARRDLAAGEGELDSFAALILLFSARPAAALETAERVLAGTTSWSARVRAASVRVGALALVDRSNEALRAAHQLLAEVAGRPTSPYARGLVHIVHQVARFVAWENHYAPATDPAAGMWPTPFGTEDVVDDDVERVAHPLFAGGRLLKEGDLVQALPLLREAVAQQSRGRGLLRSEAISLLVTAQAASGDVDGATRQMACQPPDRVALYPGLELSTRATVEAAAGRPRAVELALAAAEEAIAAGGLISAVAYLADAARYGGVVKAAERLDRLDVDFEAAIARARALYVRARATGDGALLLEAAEFHAAIALRAAAAELAQLASAALSRNRRLARRAEVLATDMRRRLRRPTADVGSAIGLTRRELEVARLAAQGMNSREIASVLVVSVRTVESHLASAYRKLDIRSRQHLGAALATLT